MSKKAAKGKASGARRGNQTEELNTHLREEFIRYYCTEARFNATRALRLATNNPKATRQQASGILKCPKVQAAINRRIYDLRESIPDIFADIVRTEMDIIKTSPFDIIDPQTGEIRDRISRRARNAAAEITVKTHATGSSVRVKPYDKGASMARLSKLVGLLVERDPQEQEREQNREAGAVITGRINGLRARLVPRTDVAKPGQDASGAESAPL